MTLPADLTTHPFPNNQRLFDAEFVRMFAQGILSHAGAQGIAGASTDLAATAGSGLTINIAAGRAFVKGSERSTQGSYFVYNDTSRAVTLAAANATNPRIDRVVLRVYESDTTAGSSYWAIEAVSGTATVGATLANLTGAAAVPANSLLLYNVLVPAAFTGPFVAGTHFQDRRFGVPVAGRELFAGVSSVTSNFNGPGDITSVTVQGDSTTAVVIEHSGAAMRTSGAAANTVTIATRDGSGGGGTQFGAASGTNGGANYSMSCFGRVRVAAFSGSKTFYAYISASAGTPTIDAGATYPFLLRATWGA